MDIFISTIIRISVAVGVSGLLFIAFNYFFSQPTRRWRLFNTITGAFFGLIYFGILDGNRFLGDVGPTLIFWPVLGAVAGGAICGTLSDTEKPTVRIPLAVGTLVAFGVLQGAAWRSDFLPSLDWGAALVWTFAAGVILGTAGLAIRRDLIKAGNWAIVGLTVGWMLGAWGGADFGAGGSRWEAYAASIVGLTLIGIRLGFTKIPDDAVRIQLDTGSRKYIFLTPALAFISLGLLIPLVRTIYLSFLARTEGGRTVTDLSWVGLENYGFIFTSNQSLNLSGWSNFFTSRLVWWGGGLLGIAVIIAFVQKFKSPDGRPSLSGGSVSPFVIGWFLIVTAVFATLRGTILNNLWWVFFVTLMATGLGLMISVLADKAKMESSAKSLIFMPMAISFVGAGIIWRFMFIARDTQKPQTGLFNSIWVGFGQLSTTNSWTGIFAIAVLIGIISGLAIFSYLSWRSNANKLALFSLLGSALGGFLLYRLIGPGLGGVITRTITVDGEKVTQSIPNTILFIEEAPFNNLWLMVILIWIQTGFAMVIFSAAIKAVPGEFIEAARVDGATESQIFWRITIPQIATTIGVVVTTLIVLVMKVYDIVKVMTNGNFGTQVLANDMWNRAFQDRNWGLGSALAVILFIAVLPIMFYNIRRMQKIET